MFKRIITVALVIIVVLGVYALRHPADNDEEITSNETASETVKVTTNDTINYETLYKTLTESLKANASKNNFTLYNIEVNEDNHIIDVYIDNYKGKEIEYDEETCKALYDYLSSYYNIDSDCKVKFRFGISFNNIGKVVTNNSYYKMMNSQNVRGCYALYRGEQIMLYESEERDALYEKEDNYDDLLSKLNKNIKEIIDSGIEIKDFDTIHDYEVDGVYDIKKNPPKYYKNGGAGDEYNVGDYSNAYDFFYEHQDTLDEDEAYDIYYDEYGEYD